MRFLLVDWRGSWGYGKHISRKIETMSQLVDGIVPIVAGLSADKKQEFVERLVSSGALTESCGDALVIASRRAELPDLAKFRAGIAVKGRAMSDDVATMRSEERF